MVRSILDTDSGARGLRKHFPVTQELLGIMRMFAEGKNTECYFARVEGKIAGGRRCIARTDCRVVWASTLPAFRNGGVQTALLEAAWSGRSERGCELGDEYCAAGKRFAEILRAGIRTLYTRVKFERGVGSG